MDPTRSAADFHVGWICAVQKEYVVAGELLDEEFDDVPAVSGHDTNIYTYGRIGKHLVVVACLPKSRYGIASAASVAKDMVRSFPSICIGLMVGIGGGAPTPKHDIRLGDVVVSTPVGRTNGVIHIEAGKAIQDQPFKYERAFNAPATILLNAVQKLSALLERGRIQISPQVEGMIEHNPRLRKKYFRPNPETDRLFRSDFTHIDENSSCADSCHLRTERIVSRPARDEDDDLVHVHYGLIASSDKVMKDATMRDRLAMTDEVLCFEMEAAGLDQFRFIVIRGICDYSDSHKNDDWQGYAAATSAAYAKQLLTILPAFDPDHVLQDLSRQLAKTIRDEGTVTRNLVQEGINSTNRIATSLERWDGQMKIRAQRDKLLGSLKFPDMNLRGNEIAESHEGTFDWIFMEEYNDYSIHLIDWLQSEHGIFWISGKAGSGKSTLMKRIIQQVQDDRTDPATGHPATVLKYFFWLPGSPHQRSCKGLLASLLHQLLSSLDETTFAEFLADRPLGDEQYLDDWSEKTLAETFLSIVDISTGHYMIFIDALDEIDPQEGGPRILKVLDSLDSLGRAKICLSSRPEAIFMSYFEQSPQLRLENLTQHDMERYIRDCLQQHLIKGVNDFEDEHGTRHSVPILDRLTKLILQKADGIFLWVHLTVRSISDGLLTYERPGELLERVDALPSKMEELYRTMWIRSNQELKSHREEAALYFRLILAKLSIEPLDRRDPSSFELLVASRPDLFQELRTANADMDLSKLRRKCARFERRLLVRTAGLVAIGKTHQTNTVAPDLASRRVEFIHRTASDFLLGSEGGQELLEPFPIDEDAAKERLFLAKLLSFKFGFITFSLRNVEDHARRVRGYQDAQKRTKLLKLMNEVCHQAFLREFQLDDVDDWFASLYMSLGETGNTYTHHEYGFGWEGVMKTFDCAPYFEELRQSTTRSFDQTYLDLLLWSATCRFDPRDDGLMVRWSLDQGANPNALFFSKGENMYISAWAMLLIQATNTAPAGSDTKKVFVSLLQHFLARGARMEPKMYLQFGQFEQYYWRGISSGLNWLSESPIMAIQVNMTELLRTFVLIQKCGNELAHNISSTEPPYRRVVFVPSSRDECKKFWDENRNWRRVTSSRDSENLLKLWHELMEAHSECRMEEKNYTCHPHKTEEARFWDYVEAIEEGEIQSEDSVLSEVGVRDVDEMEEISRITPFDGAKQWKYTPEFLKQRREMVDRGRKRKRGQRSPSP